MRLLPPLTNQSVSIQMTMTMETTEMMRTCPNQKIQMCQMQARQTRLTKHHHCPPNREHTKKGSFGTMSMMSWPTLGSLFKKKVYLPLMQIPR